MDTENIVDVNKADAIFIPSDIQGDKTDYTEYKVGFYRTVPANCALVRKNRITGKIYLVSSMDRNGDIIGGGFKLMPPFITKSIFVPIIDRTIDYPRADYETADGIKANIDIALKVKISDPVSYLTEGKHQLNQLNILTQNLLREFIKHKEYDALTSGRIDINEFDPVIAGQNGGIAQSAYQDFEKRYGIRIESVQLKRIKLPEKLQRLYDDKKEEEKKREAQLVKLEAEKERAKAEAEIIRIKADAEAEKNKKLMAARIEGLKQSGVTEERISQELSTIIASDNPHASVIVGGSSRSNEIATGVAAGAAAAQKQNNNTRVDKQISHVQTLLNMVEAAILIGNLSDDALVSYKDLRKELHENQKLIDVINGMNEEQFKQITQLALSGNLRKNSGTQSENRTRHR